MNIFLIYGRITDIYFYIQVNLHKPCPFWSDDSRCVLKDCHVDMCKEVCIYLILCVRMCKEISKCDVYCCSAHV